MIRAAIKKKKARIGLKGIGLDLIHRRIHWARPIPYSHNWARPATTTSIPFWRSPPPNGDTFDMWNILTIDMFIRQWKPKNQTYLRPRWKIQSEIMRMPSMIDRYTKIQFYRSAFFSFFSLNFSSRSYWKKLCKFYDSWGWVMSLTGEQTRILSSFSDFIFSIPLAGCPVKRAQPESVEGLLYVKSSEFLFIPLSPALDG